MCLGWTKKIRWNRVILAGIIYVVIAQLVRSLEAFLTMDYYLDPAYFGVWSKVMMPEAGPPPISFYVWSVAFGLITGVTLAVFYEWIKKTLPTRPVWKRACSYTTIVSLLTLVLAYLPMYLLVNLPLGLMVGWFASSVVIFYLGALVFVRMLK